MCITEVRILDKTNIMMIIYFAIDYNFDLVENRIFDVRNILVSKNFCSTNKTRWGQISNSTQRIYCNIMY